MKSFLRDFSGAFGDTAIFIPLALGMIIICGLSPTSVFLPAGLLYLISGWYYKIPFPVQPLKAVAAIALVNALRPELIATTAYLMSAVMLLFLFFDFSNYLDRIFSKPIVRGIQFGLGILLITSGIRLIVKGEIVTGVALPAIEFSGFFWGSNKVSLFLPSLDDIATAFVLLLIPQIPLTLGNSMVATADLARDYFGKRAKRVTYRNLAGTISAGNLLAGLIGGMPVCHGCGGTHCTLPVWSANSSGKFYNRHCLYRACSSFRTREPLFFTGDSPPLFWRCPHVRGCFSRTLSTGHEGQEGCCSCCGHGTGYPALQESHPGTLCRATPKRGLTVPGLL